MAVSQCFQLICPVRFVAIRVESGIHHIVGEILSRQTAGRDHAGQATCRVRASAETENKHLIPGFIDVGDFSVAILDLLPKTSSECAPDKFEDRITIGADSVIIERHLIRANNECLI